MPFDTSYSADIARRQTAPKPAPVSDAYKAENNTPVLFAANGTFYALAMLIVCLRLYVRAKIIKTIGPDDYVMVVAAVCLSTFLTVVLAI